jgi:uncharacterized protein YneF (UPF0154 family)
MFKKKPIKEHIVIPMGSEIIRYIELAYGCDRFNALKKFQQAFKEHNPKLSECYVRMCIEHNGLSSDDQGKILAIWEEGVK